MRTTGRELQWAEPRRTGLKLIDKDHPGFCSAPCTGGSRSLDVQSERLHASLEEPSYQHSCVFSFGLCGILYYLFMHFYSLHALATLSGRRVLPCLSEAALPRWLAFGNGMWADVIGAEIFRVSVYVLKFALWFSAIHHKKDLSLVATST